MNLTFRQGIVSYPNAGTEQQFLKLSGTYVTLDSASGVTYVTAAHGSSNYLFAENTSTTNAWGPIASGTTAWLYWNISTTNAVRTYGYTTVKPVFGITAPSTPAVDQHWFDRTTNLMKVWTGSSWQTVIRVFAAKVTTAGLSALGSNASSPYSGSQVGITNTSITAGEILADTSGKPIKKTSGEFFTISDDFFINGSPITTIKLDGCVAIRQASANIGQYNVVTLLSDETIRPSVYDDVGTSPIGIAEIGGVTGDAITFAIQGVIKNPAWNWTTIGTKLWVSDSGTLVEIDPHVSDVSANPTGKQPVGYVLSATEIYFDQGLGGKGDAGAAGTGTGGSSAPATTSVAGIARISTASVNSDDPIVVSATDPRMTNARTPLAHNQDSSTIITTNLTVVTGDTLDKQLTVIDNKLSADDKSIATNVTAIANNTTDITTLKATTAGHTTQLSTISTQITSINSKDSTQDSAISSLQTTTAANTTNISSLNTSVQAQQTSLATAQSNISSLQTTVATHTTQIASLNTSVSSLNTKVATNTTNITTLNSQVAALQTSDTAHTTQITALQTSDASQNVQIAAAQAAVSNMLALIGSKEDHTAVLTNLSSLASKSGTSLGILLFDGSSSNESVKLATITGKSGEITVAAPDANNQIEISLDPALNLSSVLYVEAKKTSSGAYETITEAMTRLGLTIKTGVTYFLLKPPTSITWSKWTVQYSPGVYATNDYTPVEYDDTINNATLTTGQNNGRSEYLYMTSTSVVDSQKSVIRFHEGLGQSYVEEIPYDQTKDASSDDSATLRNQAFTLDFAIEVDKDGYGLTLGDEVGLVGLLDTTRSEQISFIVQAEAFTNATTGLPSLAYNLYLCVERTTVYLVCDLLQVVANNITIADTIKRAYLNIVMYTPNGSGLSSETIVGIKNVNGDWLIKKHTPNSVASLVAYVESGMIPAYMYKTGTLNPYWYNYVKVTKDTSLSKLDVSQDPTLVAYNYSPVIIDGYESGTVNEFMVNGSSSPYINMNMQNMFESSGARVTVVPILETSTGHPIYHESSVTTGTPATLYLYQNGNQAALQITPVSPAALEYTEDGDSLAYNSWMRTAGGFSVTTSFDYKVTRRSMFTDIEDRPVVFAITGSTTAVTLLAYIKMYDKGSDGLATKHDLYIGWCDDDPTVRPTMYKVCDIYADAQLAASQISGTAAYTLQVDFSTTGGEFRLNVQLTNTITSSIIAKGSVDLGSSLARMTILNAVTLGAALAPNLVLGVPSANSTIGYTAFKVEQGSASALVYDTTFPALVGETDIPYVYPTGLLSTNYWMDIDFETGTLNDADLRAITYVMPTTDTIKFEQSITKPSVKVAVMGNGTTPAFLQDTAYDQTISTLATIKGSTITAYAKQPAIIISFEYDFTNHPFASGEVIPIFVTMDMEDANLVYGSIECATASDGSTPVLNLYITLVNAVTSISTKCLLVDLYPYTQTNAVNGALQAVLTCVVSHNNTNVLVDTGTAVTNVFQASIDILNSDATTYTTVGYHLTGDTKIPTVGVFMLAINAVEDAVNDVHIKPTNASTYGIRYLRASVKAEGDTMPISTTFGAFSTVTNTIPAYTTPAEVYTLTGSWASIVLADGVVASDPNSEMAITVYPSSDALTFDTSEADTAGTHAWAVMGNSTTSAAAFIGSFATASTTSIKGQTISKYVKRPVISINFRYDFAAHPIASGTTIPIFCSMNASYQAEVYASIESTTASDGTTSVQNLYVTMVGASGVAYKMLVADLYPIVKTMTKAYFKLVVIAAHDNIDTLTSTGAATTAVFEVSLQYADNRSFTGYQTIGYNYTSDISTLDAMALLLNSVNDSVHSIQMAPSLPSTLCVQYQYAYVTAGDYDKDSGTAKEALHPEYAAFSNVQTIAASTVVVPPVLIPSGS